LPAVTSVPELRRRLLEGVRTLFERGPATVRSAARGSASQRLVSRRTGRAFAPLATLEMDFLPDAR
jgi:hypothetical protein